MTAIATRKTPYHRLAVTGFVLSILALVLAFYGSLYAEKHLAGSPLREARGSAGLPAEPVTWVERVWAKGETTIFGDRIDRKMVALTERSKIANYSLQIIAFILPFFLGIAAAVIGGNALTAIERTAGKTIGNFQAVFSIMIGGFAATISGCMILSYYIWPMIPAAYTS
ncbi:MAG TPA: hypothetical protein VLM40_21555 [Gemmata sp.]|nr:hypothetical protein [Gemmata sp.]